MVASASAQLLASSTLPSYMMRSPAVNPMIVSKCSASRVQVDAVTRVGRECGGLCLGLGHLSCFRWRGWRRRRQGRAVKRSRTGMRGSCVGRCRRNQQQSTPNSHLSIRINTYASPFPPSSVHNGVDGYGDCGYGSSCDGERSGTRRTALRLFFPPFSLKF